MEARITAHKNYTQTPDLSMFQRHTHIHYEIFCFMSGNAKYFVEGNIYELDPFDILVINKSEAHSLIINEPTPYERYVVHFNAAALVEPFADTLIPKIESKPLGRYNRIAADPAQKKIWLDYLERIVNATGEEKRLYLTVLLKELCENININEEDFYCASEDERLIKYINRHLLTLSGLEDICRHFYISKTHLNRRFKAITGSTVWDYVTIKRLIAAKDFLSNGMAPNQVAEKCGWQEYSSFYRSYKAHFGTTPKADYVKK